ncbi:MAG: hypothetical protein FWF44_09190 [Defluviitaleaceae bacterium]|nr:hypothetical protein [Defluviitaleaceae bacterium]
MRPVYIIIIVVVVIIIFQVVRMARKSASHHFECPNCGAHFQTGFSKSFFTAHGLDGKYSVKCPKCGKTDMMSPMSGKE